MPSFARAFVSVAFFLQQFVTKPIGEFLSGSFVGVIEESIKSLFREAFQAGSRSCNAVLSLILSGVPRESKTEATQRKKAWKSWHNSSFSSFNFLYGSDDDDARAPRSLSSRFQSNHGYMMFGKRGAQSLTEGQSSRGLLEDLRFTLEVFVSRVFGGVRRSIRWIFRLEEEHRLHSVSLAKRRLRKWKRLYNFTASDAILKAGYPLEECYVTTEDGYVLQMHRIPRKNSNKVVFFQHGVLDTSLGWVSLGTGGSVAFAAYDDGFDVWLGNTRANPPQRNALKKKSEYWRWSANELALFDLKAQFEYIKRAKENEEIGSYSLQAVGHSLGAACLLMYAVHQKSIGKDHGLDRLVVLSPAGFHARTPFLMRSFKYLMPFATYILNRVSSTRGIGLRLPSWPLRWVTFKLMADVNRSPVFFDLFSLAFRWIFGGDSSDWTKAMSLPHYNAQAMPAVSLHLANHFAQWAKRHDFSFYDYGSPQKNMDVYGQPVPPSVAGQYALLADLPIDIAGGTSDGLIPPENAAYHEYYLRQAQVPVTMNLFEYGHLEFIFGVGNEIVTYIMKCLNTNTT
mmetsp:Transcript_9140/g.18126  ORF Transcript_9140/g.18126 Transcript_9140/m.18126 type:complete len:568 (-) Transcript_9140:626-2329(-)